MICSRFGLRLREKGLQVGTRLPGNSVDLNLRFDQRPKEALLRPQGRMYGVVLCRKFWLQLAVADSCGASGFIITLSLQETG